MQPGELIRETRKAAGLNQHEAAARCGLSRSIFDRWERGVAEVPPATLAGVLLLLGATAKTATEAGRRAVEAQ